VGNGLADRDTHGWTDVVARRCGIRALAAAPRSHQWQSEMSAATSTASARVRRVGLGLGAVALATLLATASASAAGSHAAAFHPVKRTPRALIFHPRRVDGAAVVKASVRFRVRRSSKVSQAARKVSLRRVRQSLETGRRLKVWKPRRARGGRLTIHVRRGSQSGHGESCTFGTFSAGSPPGACWRPYSDSSPFNRTVPAAPRLAANSTAMVGRVLGFGQAANMVGGVADTPDDWGQPIYYSQPSDPVYTVHCTRAWGTCEVEGMQVRIPSAARPAGGGDGHMAVVDQQNGWEYDFWQVQSKPAGGGTISISWGGRTAIGTATADGLGSNATAAHFGILAGLIRLPELESMQINHALAMVVKCTNGTSVWPAESGTGTSCSSIGLSNADAPAMGQHFYLAMSDSEINALAVPQWKKAILFALARYGAFVRDTGGGSWGFSGESGSSYTSFGRVDPWRRVGDMPGVYLNGSDRVLDIRGGVDWSRLRAVDPCVAQSTC
jgi:hypothetical protein